MSDQPTPTVGRVVLFKSGNLSERGEVTAAEPVPALVTRVNEDGTLNLSVQRDRRQSLSVPGVPFVEDMEAFSPAEGSPDRGWGWMPYQKAVHAGTVEPVKHAAPEPPKED